MPLRILLSALVCLALCGPTWSEEFDGDAGDADYPYDAFINTDDVYVRSGPGQNYYPVLRLQRGDRVEVYRHDPGGWYAVRPPAECFSWVSADFVEPGEGKIARIKGDRVVARVGSAFSDIRDVIQVRLDEGELVEVLEAKRIGTGPAAQTWYKIAPRRASSAGYRGSSFRASGPSAKCTSATRTITCSSPGMRNSRKKS